MAARRYSLARRNANAARNKANFSKNVNEKYVCTKERAINYAIETTLAQVDKSTWV